MKMKPGQAKRDAVEKLPLKFTIFFAVGIFLGGCAPALIPMDKDALARLSSHSEIVAVHYSRPSPSPRSQSSYWLPTGASPIGNAIGVGILLLQLAADNAGPPNNYCWDDPVTKVKERFASTLNRELDLRNVRLVEEALSDDDPEALRSSLGPSMVIDFKTLECGRGAGAGQLEYYSARARLFFLQDFKVVWQGRCNVRARVDASSGLESAHRGSDAAPETANIEKVLEGCVEELIAQFTR